MDDPRFARFATDPKFRSLPKKHRKVAIDNRFKAMFKEERFMTKKSKVDKRGRPIQMSSKENFKKYYDLQNDDSDDGDDDDETEGHEHQEQKEGTKDKVKAKLEDMSVDYARGEGLIDSDSSSSSEEELEEESDDDEEDNEQTGFDKWGELDHDTQRTDEATKRLAICNMDWDRVGPEDLFVVMSSFCPAGGSVKSVKIYISEFGKSRLKNEDQFGPEELRPNETTSQLDFDDDVDEESVDKKAMERVRQYQINKLKYFYAIADFDSVGSSDAVYKHCDGSEYELSATRFDLRFVPDDMTFEKSDLKGQCGTMPDPDKYKPKQFVTTALQLGKVDLTWDETDPQRVAAMKRAFEVDPDCEDEEINQLIAASSDDSGEDEPGKNEDDDSDGDAIEKYKKLLLGNSGKEEEVIDDGENEAEAFGNMEVVFKEESATSKDKKDMTPWEKYLDKRKEISKSKRDKRGEIPAFSDDELPNEAFNDDFFKDKGVAKKKGKSKKDKQKLKKEKEAKEKQEASSQLNLLVMDSEDEDRKHFDFNEIVKQESKKKKWKKNLKRKREGKSVEEDDFKIDLKDKRFQDMFEKPEFNVDPSNPSFKKTKSMQKIIEEKQRRLKDNPDSERKQKPSKRSKFASEETERLLKSLKKRKLTK